jgi:hypothetical protein
MDTSGQLGPEKPLATWQTAWSVAFSSWPEQSVAEKEQHFQVISTSKAASNFPIKF